MALYCTQEKHYRFNAWKQKKNSHFLGKRNDKILYYDCSNYYFEIEQEDGSKKYGKSKEHRPNLIIQMGLFMDGDGIPLAFSLFPGNSNKQTSLKPLEKKVLADFGCQMNIPDGFTSAVRWYGNHFLDSLLCIPNHNFCWDICKDCYAPQMRQGLDKYPNRNG